MENQVPHEEVQRHFDQLLAEVQEIAREVCRRDEHTVQEVLVEGINEHDASPGQRPPEQQYPGAFSGDASMIGTLQKVYLEESRGFYYMGRLA